MRTGFHVHGWPRRMDVFCQPDLGPGLWQYHVIPVLVRRGMLRTRDDPRLCPKRRYRFRRQLRNDLSGRNRSGRPQIRDLEPVRLRQRVAGSAKAQHRRIQKAFLGGRIRRCDLGGEQSAETCKTNCCKPKCSVQSRPPNPNRERGQSTLILCCAQREMMFRGPLTGILVNASAVQRLRGYGVPLDETTSYRRCFEPKNTPRSSLRGANGSAQAPPDDRLRDEAIQGRGDNTGLLRFARK